MRKVDRAIMVLAGAGIIGILMIVFGPRLAIPWSTIVTNIGMGFLVAGIVGITVELYVREQMRRQMDRMLHDVGTDVFKAALGHEFPKSIWEQVSTHLLLNPVIRENLCIDYDLKNLSGHVGEFVKVRTCWSYTVRNLNTTREWIYWLSCALDRCPASRFSDQARFTCIEVNGQRIADEWLIKDANEAEVTCKTEVTLQPGQRKEVRIYGKSIYRSDQVIPFSMTDPTENLTVNVSKPKNIAVTVDPLHPREERLKEVEAVIKERNAYLRFNSTTISH